MNTVGRTLGGLRKSVVAQVVIVIAVAAQALALDPGAPSATYLRTNFTVEDGLASNIVRAVLQTRDGFLWIGTKDGLSRFDGRHFTAIDFLPQQSPGVSVEALAESPDGALWVGTRAGLAQIPNATLSRPDHSSSIVYHPVSDVGASIQCLHFSRDGVLWVGTDAGLYRFEGSKFAVVIARLWISRIEESSSGNLLVITSQGFMEWDGTKTLEHADLPRRLGVHTNEIFHVFEDHRGVIWYCTAAGVARQINGSLERLAPYGLLKAPKAFRAYEDAHGSVWVAQSDGLSRVTASGLQVVIPDMHSSYLASDRDGDSWVGTNGGGLVRLKNRTVRMFTSADGLPSGVPMAVLAASNGKLWVAAIAGVFLGSTEIASTLMLRAAGLSTPAYFPLQKMLTGTFGLELTVVASSGSAMDILLSSQTRIGWRTALHSL